MVKEINMKKRFCPATITLLLSALFGFGIISIYLTVSFLTKNAPGPDTLINELVAITVYIVLTVILFAKCTNAALPVIFGIYSVLALLNVAYTVISTGELRFNEIAQMLTAFVSRAFMVLYTSVFISDKKSLDKFKKVLRNLRFIPVILVTFNVIFFSIAPLLTSDAHIVATLLLGIINIISGILSACNYILICNWITNPYKTVKNIQADTHFSNADEIKKYKDLLDSGAITQEEFEAKKKQLLGL